MGLDNGIEIKKIKDNIIFNLDNEICYWRKCWGLRDDIIEYLRTVYPDNKEEYAWNLSKEDIVEIINITDFWDNKQKWNKESRSIWKYKEYKNTLKASLNNLHYLLAKMEDYPDGIEVEFYDSF